jgi:acyl-coenzyme A synthetase/AMP-(fatty) acid ligase
MLPFDDFSRVDVAIDACCACFADRVALSDGRTTLRYADLQAAVTQWEHKAGGPLPRGSRVAIVAPNSIAYLLALFAVIRSGAVPFLMDYALTDEEVNAICADTGITHLLLPSQHNRKLPGVVCLESAQGLSLCSRPFTSAAPALRPDTVVCRFTTGTQGRPKCLEFSHRAVIAAATTWSSANRYSEEDRIFCLAAFFNGLAFNTSLLATFLSGASLHVYAGWASPSMVMRAFASAKATRLIGFPVFYRMLADCEGIGADMLSRVKQCVSASSRLDPSIRSTVSERFGLHIMDYYGIAEVGPVTYDPTPETSADNGIMLPGVEVRVDDDNVLRVKSPSMASGYLNFPELFEGRVDSEGFYRSGDVGEIVGGRLKLGGRIDGVIDINGKKFDPKEVEGALRTIPGVRDALVIARDAGRHTEVAAVIETDVKLERADLIRLLGDRVVSFKIPSRFCCVRQLPRNGAGKIIRSRVAILLEALS